MGIWNEYPNTNAHELNLDWIIKKVKELSAEWAQTRTDWTNVQAAWEDMKAYVNNYFDNLDVQNEINVKLDDMAESGELSPLIAPFVESGLPGVVELQLPGVVALQIGGVVEAQLPYVVQVQLPDVVATYAAGQVAAWLAEHVNPETGYVIDDTLTIQGAAADAKAVGDAVGELRSALNHVINDGNFRHWLTTATVKIGNLDEHGEEISGTHSIVTKDFIYTNYDGYAEINDINWYGVLYEYSTASTASYIGRKSLYYGMYLELEHGKYYKLVVHSNPSTVIDDSDIPDACAAGVLMIYRITNPYNTVMSKLYNAKGVSTLSDTLKKYDFVRGVAIDAATGEPSETPSQTARIGTPDLIPTNNGIVLTLTHAATVYVYKYDKNGTYISPRKPLVYNTPMTLDANEFFRIQIAKSDNTAFDYDNDEVAEYAEYVSVTRTTQFGYLLDRIDSNSYASPFTLVCKNVSDFISSEDYDSSDYSYTNVTSYIDSEEIRSDQGLSAIIDLSSVKNATNIQILISRNSNLYGYKRYYVPCNTKYYYVYNLLPNATYYYKIVYALEDGTKSSISGLFTTANKQTRMLNIDGIQNVRDIGGYTVSGGKVAYGKIIRGSAMDESEVEELHITEIGKNELLKYVGIKADLDFRSGYSESVLGNYVDYQTASVGAYAGFHPEGLADALGKIVTDLSNNKPVYIHCQGGCDRTGTAVTFLLGLLGVSESDLAKEYELTCFSPIGGGRYRSSNNPSGYNYSGMIERIKTYTGATLQDKIEAVFLAGGATVEQINAFKSAMIVS